MGDSPESQLAAPGAGLPPFERWIAGLGVKTLARFAPKQVITRLFVTEARRAMTLVRSVSPQRGRVPVLVPRIRGVEDSSRNWSVYMTAEHLVIVNTGIAALLQGLCSERQTQRAVRIEDVKPHAEAGPEQADALAAVIARYTQRVERLGDLRSPARHAHPWFGRLNARQWHALAAIHNRLHRVQLERILRGLAVKA